MTSVETELKALIAVAEDPSCKFFTACSRCHTGLGRGIKTRGLCAECLKHDLKVARRRIKRAWEPLQE